MAWLPLVTLPAVIGMACAAWPAYALMWALAASIYGGLKWLTYADCPQAEGASWQRTLGYLLLWPGMDAKAFFKQDSTHEAPLLGEWLRAIAKTLLGLMLFYGAAPLAIGWNALLAGWLAMAGFVFAMHCGLLHVLSLAWRRGGVRAAPIMNRPLLASSLSDFWSRRWNLAFRDVSHAYVFQPLVGTLGGAGATLAVFLASGLIHDLAISIPAQAGYGWPTLYFLLQGAAVLLERSAWGKWLGLRRGIRGRTFAAAVVLLPVGWLFHTPFIERVVLPTLEALGAY